MAAHYFHVLYQVFLCSFSTFLRYFTKKCTLIRVILNISGWTWTYYH